LEVKEMAELGKEEKQEKGYSHVLLLANGKRVNWAADDFNPHAAPPTEIDSVAVINVSHATVGGSA
jgi:hypothetical protein